MDRKVFNTNSYTVGHRNNSWHNFMDTVANCFIGLVLVLVVLAIVITATVLIWA